MIAEEITQTSQAITFAVVGGFITILTLVINNRSKSKTEKLLHQHQTEMEIARRSEKEEDRAAEIEKEERDYARQDIVAQRADERADALLASSTAALRTTQKVVTMTQKNSESLDSVHFLVNSNLTAHYESRLSTLKISLSLAQELADMQRVAGREPAPGTLATIQATEAEITQLEKEIIERKVTDAQSAAMLTQPSLDREAAELQVEAAATQQIAADRQQAAADQIATALTPLPPPSPPNQQ